MLSSFLIVFYVKGPEGKPGKFGERGKLGSKVLTCIFYIINWKTMTVPAETLIDLNGSCIDLTCTRLGHQRSPRSARGDGTSGEDWTTRLCWAEGVQRNNWARGKVDQ